MRAIQKMFLKKPRYLSGNFSYTLQKKDSVKLQVYLYIWGAKII